MMKRTTSLLTCLVLAVLAGCERPPDEQMVYDNSVGDAVEDQSPYRIVSLAPALSRMLVDLGQGDAIVGVAEFDAAAPPGLPVVGNYLNVSGEALIKLKPTHVLLMTDKHGTPDALRDYSRSIGFELVVYPYPYSVENVINIIFDARELPGIDETPDRPSLGTLFAGQHQALRLSNQIMVRLGAVSRVVASQPRPNTLMVISVEPQVMASAPGKTGMVLNHLLGFAGAVNAAADAPVTAPTYDHEALLKLQPEVILLLLPGDPPITAPRTDSRLAGFRGLDIPAVRNNRIHLINDPQVLLPATNVAQVAALLAKALHPSLAAEVDKVMAADPAAIIAAQAPSTQPAANVGP